MAYSKINWENKPSKSTPINKTNLNNMDTAIYENDNAITYLRTLLGIEKDTYDSSKTYEVDDRVVYKHLLYKCITAVETPEEFDSTKWEIVPIIKV